jgi:hypothetical protein
VVFIKENKEKVREEARGFGRERKEREGLGEKEKRERKIKK